MHCPLLLLLTAASALEADEGLSLLQTRADRRAELLAHSFSGAGSDARALDGGLPELVSGFFGSAADAEEEEDDAVKGKQKASRVNFAAQAAEDAEAKVKETITDGLTAEKNAMALLSAKAHDVKQDAKAKVKETITDLGSAEEKMVARLSASVDEVKQVGAEIGGELVSAEKEMASRLAARVQARFAGREELSEDSEEAPVTVAQNSPSQEEAFHSVSKKEKKRSDKAKDREDFERLDITVTTVAAEDEVMETRDRKLQQLQRRVAADEAPLLEKGLGKGFFGDLQVLPKRTKGGELGAAANAASNATSTATSNAAPDAAQRWVPDALEEAA